MPEKIKRYLYKDEVKKSTGMSFEKREVKRPSLLHWHNYFEVEMITDGSGYQILNGKQFELTRGCFYLSRLTDYHKVVPQDNLKLCHFILNENMLSAEFLRAVSGSETPIFLRLTEDELSILCSIFELCMEENNSKAPNLTYLKGLVKCFFIKAIKAAPKIETEYKLLSSPIQSAVQYIHLHFRESPSLSAAAKIAHYNKSHFSTSFKEEMGVNYCDYLNALKVDYAKELLLSTNLNIQGVGFESGFTSHSNFLRIFKLVTGTSPLQFRKLSSN